MIHRLVDLPHELAQFNQLLLAFARTELTL